MKNKTDENTLFLGNGFSRALFRNMPSWGDLFDGVGSSIKNYTILYEAFRLNSDNQSLNEEEVKNTVIKKIQESFSKENIRDDIRELKNLGLLLEQHHVNNIITTNYDNGIELILCHYCGYKKKRLKGIPTEQIYSIRTYNMFYNEITGHNIKIWKIHGDMDRIKSITLGFDQYCGSLSKLTDYIKGSYKSSKNYENAECKMYMKQKCSEQKFDHLSWAELFFCTNLYIVGFGMDFSEVDIWWLLNKRVRFQLEVPQINNAITYLYIEQYKKSEDPAIFAALDAFHVSCKYINAGPDYITSIFNHID